MNNITAILVGLILFTIVLLSIGSVGYWLHLRLLRLEQRVSLCGGDCGGGSGPSAGSSGSPAMPMHQPPFSMMPPFMSLHSNAVKANNDAGQDLPDDLFDDNDDLDEEQEGQEEAVLEVDDIEDDDDDRLSIPAPAPVTVQEVQVEEIVRPETTDMENTEDEGEAGADETPDYEHMTVAALRELCEQRGIATSRKDRKGDVIAKLQHGEAALPH